MKTILTTEDNEVLIQLLSLLRDLDEDDVELKRFVQKTGHALAICLDKLQTIVAQTTGDYR